jgi:hypothetical protein
MIDINEINTSHLCNFEEKLILELGASMKVISRLVKVVKNAKELDALGYDHYPIDGILSLEKVLRKYYNETRSNKLDEITP